jgi:hypothetical protein
MNITRDYDELTLNITVRFVDRDMFMRYTSFGIGHPLAIRRITRDCLDLEAPADTMDIDHEGASDGEGLEECDDDDEEEEESDYAFSDQELDGGDGGSDDGEFDDLSF